LITSGPLLITSEPLLVTPYYYW